MDTIEDKQFPAQGKVFEEAPMPLPGLAGESRSADANGSWFRVLAAGGKNLVTLKPGVFATTPEPLLGANPPKPTRRPPLNAGVACETQQPPDLRTNPAPPPEQKTVNTDSPAFQARYALARAKAIKWLERQLKTEGLDGKLKIAGEDATPRLIDKIASGAGR
jgi:hypothetical protein